MKTLNLIIALAAAAALSACAGSLASRDKNTYQADTRALLESHNARVEQCYDQALAQDAAVAGIVVVNFKVAAKTGAISEPALDAAKSTAPASLSQCILSTLEGLTLAPADRKQGIATFRWDFTPRA